MKRLHRLEGLQSPAKSPFKHSPSKNTLKLIARYARSIEEAVRMSQALKKRVGNADKYDLETDVGSEAGTNFLKKL